MSGVIDELIKPQIEEHKKMNMLTEKSKLNKNMVYILQKYI